ncbi:hypothetical protein [Xenorhabdus entomophaga]|uniref:hypothetical protein n=1 Tax=Xenorhabdus entomophaga TaxID=3136257 RepID=UPI0030F3CADA
MEITYSIKDIDWGLIVAVIAVVIGMGSLYLTWHSTKSAKKSIDTSINIYERQKEDEVKNKILADKAKTKATWIHILSATSL